MIVAILAFVAPAYAQSTSIAGNISALVDHLPNVPPPGGSAGGPRITELRLRAIADAQLEAKPWLRFRLMGLADGLVADRDGSVRDASGDALEAWVEFSGPRADLRAGMSRIAWGRLDEVQPTDVINPIDVARYLLDGRSDARVAVPLVRVRLFPNDKITFEGVVVPVFRPSTFDRLDESTSRFNLLRDLPPPACPPGALCLPVWGSDRETPGGVQAGGRISMTAGRVDFSVSGWRGFVPFGLVTGISARAPGSLVLEHPRYVMLGGDVETVRGQWALRGEAAYFPDRPLQIENEARWFEGNAFEAGAGVDRRAGDFTLSGTVLFRRTDAMVKRDPPPAPGDPLALVDPYHRTVLTRVSAVAGFSRTFNRDRVETRVFSLVNPDDRAAFLRGLLTWKPMDDVAIETSIGWFIGDGDDVITRFGDRDFGYVRFKYYFGR